MVAEPGAGVTPLRPPWSRDQDARFEHGLALLIDSVAGQLAGGRVAAPGPALAADR
jgi:hypothetical protein